MCCHHRPKSELSDIPALQSYDHRKQYLISAKLSSLETILNPRKVIIRNSAEYPQGYHHVKQY